MKIHLIVALDLADGFSKNGEIPWINEPFAREDLRRFRSLTMDHTVIMGRLTYEDIRRFTKTAQILPDRDCVVLSRDPTYQIDDIPIFNNMKSALECVDHTKDVFIIGGYSLFEEAFKWHLDTIHITRVLDDYKCDKRFPTHLIADNFKGTKMETFEYNQLAYITYERI